MKVISENIGEISLQDYIANNQDLIILVAASYDKEMKIGKSRSMLYYNKKTKVIVRDFIGMQSANEVTVLGLLDAVKHILISKVNVCVISYWIGYN